MFARFARFVRFGALFGLGLGLALGPGCAPVVTVGAPCVLSSECDPLACLAGRCRNECRTSRDCPFGLACVDVGAGASACRVPEDEGGCTPTVCPAPLACQDGVCVQPCTDASDCIVENVCAGSACAPAPMQTIGACSPTGVVSGCGDSEVCARSGDSFACAPSPASITPLGQACTGEAQCGTGSGCISGRCVRLCAPGTSSCGAEQICRATLDLLGIPPGGTIGPAPVSGLGYCTEACDPLVPAAMSGCPMGTECSFAVIGGDRVASYCRSLELPALAVDASCDMPIDPDRCPPGTLCESFTGPRTCIPFCDPDAATPCAGGRPCTRAAAGGAPFYVCMP